MFPNLLEATKQYWHQLDELEAAYQRGDVSLAEVDSRVAELMAELGRERRAALSYFFRGMTQFWREQQELVVGVTAIGILASVWLINS